MASVKWLTDMIVVQDHFTGPFHTDDYAYYDKHGTAEPITINNIISTILQPMDKQILPEGNRLIKGVAKGISHNTKAISNQHQIRQ